MARLFADENLPLPVVDALRRIGHDIVTLSDIGKAGQSLTDKAVLLLAIADDRAVVTLNRKHFVRLHGTEANHAGIIVCSFDLDFDGQAARIDAAISPYASMGRRLVRVNRPGSAYPFEV